MTRAWIQKGALLFLCAVLNSMTGCKSKPLESKQGPLDFAKAFQWSQSYEASTQILVVNVRLKDGFHAYAPGETVGRAVELTLSDTNGWKLKQAPLYPQGETKSLGEIGTTKFLEKEFTIKANVEGGKDGIHGVLKMQLCTENACDRPREHPFSVSTTH